MGASQTTIADSDEPVRPSTADSGSTESSTLLGKHAVQDRDRDRDRDRQPMAGDWNDDDERDGQLLDADQQEDVVVQSPSRWWRKASVYWLIGPYLLFTLAFGGVIVPKLNLIVDLVCHEYFADQSLIDPNLVFTPVRLGGNNPQCTMPPVQKSVAKFTLVTGVLTGVLSAFTAPKLGSLSDRYGRTRLLVVASCGGVVNEIITILAARYPDVVDYHWLILGAFFDGITGSFTAGSILSSSYTSDCSAPSRRAVNIGYLHACLFTGLAFGPFLSAKFVERTGSLLSIFYMTLACHVFFILFVYFITPESLSKRHQWIARKWHQTEQEERLARLRSDPSGLFSRLFRPSMTAQAAHWLFWGANPLAPLKLLVPGGAQNGLLRRNMLLLASIDTIIIMAVVGSGTVTLLYVSYVFRWGTTEASAYISFISVVRVVVLLGILPLVNWFFRLRHLDRRRQRQRQRRRRRREEEEEEEEEDEEEEVEDEGDGDDAEEANAGADELDLCILRAALLSDVAGLLLYVLARSPAVFVAGSAVAALGGLGSAVIQTIITKQVPPDRVGALLGAIGLLHALGRVVSPVLFNGLYAATVETFPKAFFVLLLGLFVLALLCSVFVRPHVFLHDHEHVPLEEASSAPSFTASRLATSTALEVEVAAEPLARV